MFVITKRNLINAFFVLCAGIAVSGCATLEESCASEYGHPCNSSELHQKDAADRARFQAIAAGINASLQAQTAFNEPSTPGITSCSRGYGGGFTCASW